jgi:hypothetical protein
VKVWTARRGVLPHFPSVSGAAVQPLLLVVIMGLLLVGLKLGLLVVRWAFRPSFLGRGRGGWRWRCWSWWCCGTRGQDTVVAAPISRPVGAVPDVGPGGADGPAGGTAAAGAVGPRGGGAGPGGVELAGLGEVLGGLVDQLESQDLDRLLLGVLERKLVLGLVGLLDLLGLLMEELLAHQEVVEQGQEEVQLAGLGGGGDQAGAVGQQAHPGGPAAAGRAGAGPLLGLVGLLDLLGLLVEDLLGQHGGLEQGKEEVE